MKTLETYLKTNLRRADPHPAIDHSIRAQLHQDGRISFYIHADGRDSDTLDFWVKGNELYLKRIEDEFLPEDIKERVLQAVRKLGYRVHWGYGTTREAHNTLCLHPDCDHDAVMSAIESVEGVTATSFSEDDNDRLYRPHWKGSSASS